MFGRNSLQRTGPPRALRGEREAYSQCRLPARFGPVLSFLNHNRWGWTAEPARLIAWIDPAERSTVEKSAISLAGQINTLPNYCRPAYVQSKDSSGASHQTRDPRHELSGKSAAQGSLGARHRAVLRLHTGCRAFNPLRLPAALSWDELPMAASKEECCRNDAQRTSNCGGGAILILWSTITEALSPSDQRRWHRCTERPPGTDLFYHQPRLGVVDCVEQFVGLQAQEGL